MLKRLFILFFLLVGFSTVKVDAQILPPDSVYRPNRLALVVGIESSLYVGSFAWLYSNWYKDYHYGGFHTFNDNKEWLQVDKVGHATTSYFVGKVGYDMLRWSGINESNSIIYGGGLGFLYQTTVEVFDGFSNGWGFSWGDMAANALGTSLFIGQQVFWQEQRFSLKFSFHYTDYAHYRPNMLGNTYLERMLKDYNGQTYWLSTNISSFLPDGNRFPKWLNVAVGYGAEGMLGGFGNPSEVDGVVLPEFDRYRQYYLSLDLDLTRIPVKNQFLKTLFNTISFIKFPFPALEFSRDGVGFYPLYF